MKMAIQYSHTQREKFQRSISVRKLLLKYENCNEREKKKEAKRREKKPRHLARREIPVEKMALYDIVAV